MKSIKNYQMTFFIMILSLFLSCQDNDKIIVQVPEPSFKSAVVLPEPNCAPKVFDLLIKQSLKAGELQISNNDDYLVLQYIPDEKFTFSDIKFWIGTNPKKVPSDKNKLPLADKFKYKSTITGELVFVIPISEIYTRNSDIACEAKKLIVFTNVTADIAATEETEEIPAWSSGTVVGNSQSVSYSTYTTCCQSTGGGGCFPHFAWGGNYVKDDVYYYDNQTGGSQNIHADNDVIAGWVKLETGVLTFSFNQDWMFNPDLSPEIPLVEIYGCYQPGVSPTPLFSGKLSSNQGIYSISISSYPYYLVKFKLQNCYTVNP